MKNLTQISLTVTSLLLLNGCSPSGLMNYQLNPKLPILNNVKAIASNTSVAFEWQPLSAKGVDGINIYRTDSNEYVNSQTKELKIVGRVKSKFSSHYVDSGLEQNSRYTYTFTTIKDGFESAHGQIIKIKTLAPFEGITFFQGFQRAQNIIKLIWRPHIDKRVKMYKIEKSINGGKWKWIASVENRMMSEYIDTYVAPANTYTYRVLAVGFDDSISRPSNSIVIRTR